MQEMCKKKASRPQVAMFFAVFGTVEMFVLVPGSGYAASHNGLKTGGVSSSTADLALCLQHPAKMFGASFMLFIFSFFLLWSQREEQTCMCWRCLQ